MQDESAGRKRTYLVGQTEISGRPLAPGLYLVATPIGNLGDITLRALETLASADVLACEDTRVTRILLNRYGIAQRPSAYHEHNASEVGPRLIAALEEGRSVALVSDAGTPLVSDPGFRLVETAREKGIAVFPVPGASAVLAALSGAALPTDAFFFAGFLPVKDGQRRTRLEELKAVPGTLVFFESPHRLSDTLAAMAETYAGRPGAVCRELTKTFEEFRRGAVEELAAHYAEAGAPKGEIVICVGPPVEQDPDTAIDIDALLLSLAGEMGASKAAGEAAKMTGRRKAELYQRLMELRGDGKAG